MVDPSSPADQGPAQDRPPRLPVDPAAAQPRPAAGRLPARRRHPRPAQLRAPARPTWCAWPGQHIQRMQKALELMNLKLTKVLGDVTGRDRAEIIRAILAGKRDPHKLAQCRDRSCRHSGGGDRPGPGRPLPAEHVFALQPGLRGLGVLPEASAKVDAAIQRSWRRCSGDRALPPLPAKACRSGRKPHDPRFDVRAALYCGGGHGPDGDRGDRRATA